MTKEITYEDYIISSDEIDKLLICNPVIIYRNKKVERLINNLKKIKNYGKN